MSLKNLTIDKLIHAILANPITKWGHDSYVEVASDELSGLNKNEQILDFLDETNGGYAMPCFLDNDYLNQINSLENDESDDDSISYYFKNYKTINEYARIKSEFNHFRDYFLRDNNWIERRLFTITGTAGAGKTTLANKLISQKSNKLQVRPYDFETAATKQITFINKTFPEKVAHKPSAVISFILILVEETGSILHKKFNGKFTIEFANELIKRIGNICEVYNKYFNNPQNTIIDGKDNFSDFFEILIDFNSNLSNQTETIVDYAENFTLSLQKYFEKIFEDTFNESSVRSKKEQEEIKIENAKKLLFILFILYFCLSKTDEYQGNQFLLFIDNIEYEIIEKDNKIKAHILISDVSIIFKSILSAIYESSHYILKMLEEFKDIEYSPASGVLLTMRDTTDGFFQEIRRSIDIEYNRYANIDITSYFNGESILRKKIKYFFDVDIKDYSNLAEDVKEALTAYHNVVSDKSYSKWCLGGFIHEFYNNNHRKIVKNIIELIFTNIKEFKTFNKHWMIIKKASAEERKTDNFKNYKHIVRQFFIRLLLGYVNSPCENAKGIFDELKKQPHFYTRRVLTYLHNISLEEDKFINTNQLIEDILLKPNVINLIKYNNVDDNAIGELAQALFIMNSIKPSLTSWTNMIYIEVPGGNTFEQEDLLELIKDNWNKYKNNNRKLPDDLKHVTVKITYAGKLYVWFMAEFEYFACRYAIEYPALFMAKNHNDLKLIIDMVAAATLKDDLIHNKLPCIANHLINESNFLKALDGRGYHSPLWLYKNSPNNNGTVHPKRILIRHRTYLKKFLQYINSKYIDSEIKYTNEIKTILNNTILKYSERLQQLEKDYPEYMGLN